MINTDSPEQATATPAERSLAVRQAQGIQTGDRGLKLTNYEEMYRFAKAVAESKFKPYPDWTVVDCFICLQKGAELGMTPMQSLEAIYIVNNRGALYGDAPKGIVESSGLMIDYDQYEEGKPFEDDYKFVVMSHRKGRSKPLITTYSVADAKTAGLWEKRGRDGKPSAWITAPKRMLMFRARGFNLRDNFPDVLRGFAIAELIDEEGIAGFENAKAASAKVVEPNFDKPAPAPEPTELQLPPRRGPGRPRKNPVPEEPKQAEAEPAKEPEPQPELKPEPEDPVVSTIKATTASLFPRQDESTFNPALEVIRRLKESRLSEVKFLELMREYGFVEAELGDITMGDFTIPKMQKEDLELALKSWPQIIKNLTGDQK